MKALDGDGVVVAYAQWTLPKTLWERLGGPAKFADVDESMKAEFEKEAEESCTSDGEPKGMRVEVVEACSPAMRAAGREVFPRDGEYICRFLLLCWCTERMTEGRVVLNQVKTLPEHQRRGAGSALLQWGVELADLEGLKICLEATPFGLGMYKKFG